MSREEEQESPDESNNVSEEGDDINEDDIVNEADRKPPRLFTFTCVNSYGNAEVDAIKDDGKPIRFSNRYNRIVCIQKKKHIFKIRVIKVHGFT